MSWTTIREVRVTFKFFDLQTLYFLHINKTEDPSVQAGG